MTEFRTKFPQRAGVSRIWHAGIYSLRGLAIAWQGQAAFRQEALLAMVMIPAAFWLTEDAVERILLLGSVVLVLIIELCNSAIEAVVDRVGSELHPLSGAAKDMGSAAVLLSLLLMLLVWALIALQRVGA
ncbi:diacylglycerol kinase [Woeseia oceani]|uniref:Diacylglycerol kinase n=1 Tax=Woeseia oceani TaxID=1548547 RepID=A0A193LIY0_9GAMM|nr:diacylglycerol kinase [Woeseia oceani]ANO52431.1 diacylglycerol kinase [Woeseia oceani]